MCEENHYFTEVEGMSTCINCGLVEGIHLESYSLHTQRVPCLKTELIMKLYDFCINNHIAKSTFHAAEINSEKWGLKNYEECMYGLYRALTQQESAYTLQEIAALSMIPLKMLRNLDYKISMKFNLPPVAQDSKWYLNRFAARLNLSKVEVKLAEKILSSYIKIKDKQPHVYAAAAIYHICKENKELTLKTAAQACSTTSATLGAMYKLHTAKVKHSNS